MHHYRLLKLAFVGLFLLGMGITQSYDAIAARRNTWKISDLYISGAMLLAGLLLLGFTALQYRRHRD